MIPPLMECPYAHRHLDRPCGGLSVEIEAADGADALASLRAGLPVDLVLSDVVMPQLNGVQLLEALSASHPDLPALPDLVTITLVRSTPAQRPRPQPERSSSRRPRSERRLRGAPPNRARLR